MDSSSLWARRSNTGKLSLTTSSSDSNSHDHHSRTYTAPRRFGGETSSHGKNNPFNALGPLTPSGTTGPPSAGAATAFGLGSGAFASFGSSKTPKSPGNGLDFASAAANTATPSPGPERGNREKDGERSGSRVRMKASTSSLANSASPSTPDHPLKYSWVVWYRPPTSKYSDYEKSMVPLASLGTVEAFWTVYTHLKRPSALPSVSDYHFFRKGIRPVWEDQENRRGGKWILRLKKGVADRYWEDLLLAMIGDQFAEAGEEVCGAVLSVRSGEDVLSVWTRIDGGRNIKIRETIKRLLAFPPDTSIVWRSHDESIAQRSALEQARQEKSNVSSSDKRHSHGKDEGGAERNRNS
ncbi:MAG: hypothetical protein M1823_002654 [Watsoniomyces obsoletus]|nr:MAG: hypothetical protein M1823_002654 [Watsoniomyces obsoletus]